MKFLVCIVSDSSTPELEAMTQACIDSIHLDEGHGIVVSDKQGTIFRGAVTIKQEEPFNYNNELNRCAERGLHWKPDYIAFCNNDLMFTKGWSSIVEDMKKHGLESISPICPRSHKQHGLRVSKMVSKGYKVGIHFPGWCFVWSTDLYNRIGLRTNCRFYCADNETVEQLKENGIEHGLSHRVVVEHLGSQTLKDKSIDEKDSLCFAPVRKFNKLYNQNIFNLGE